MHEYLECAHWVFLSALVLCDKDILLKLQMIDLILFRAYNIFVVSAHNIHTETYEPNIGMF